MSRGVPQGLLFGPLQFPLGQNLQPKDFYVTHLQLLVVRHKHQADALLLLTAAKLLSNFLQFNNDTRIFDFGQTERKKGN